MGRHFSFYKFGNNTLNTLKLLKNNPHYGAFVISYVNRLWWRHFYQSTANAFGDRGKCWVLTIQKGASSAWRYINQLHHTAP